MKAVYICHSCRSEFDVEDAEPGESIPCPDCGSAMRPKPRAKRRADPEERWDNKLTCYVFGVIFSIFGILLAYVCSGRKGARMATRGAIIGLAIYAGLLLVHMSMRR